MKRKNRNKPVKDSAKQRPVAAAAVQRPEIDGLRAFAIVPVVLYHAGLGFPGGFVGVDVFFVISGFLIGGIIFRELDAGTFSFFKFWERRARRIVPASLFFCAVTLAVGAKVLLPSDFVSLGGQTAAALVGLANFKMLALTDNYWAVPASSLWLLHTWSLAVEEQFYLLMPLILVLARQFFPRRRLLIVLVLTALSAGLCHRWGSRAYAGNFFLLPSRAWELLLGCLGAWFLDRGHRLPKPARMIGSVAGLTGIVVSALVLHQDKGWPDASALLPTISTLLILISPEPPGRATVPQRLLSLPPLRFLGLISYSMYLWHWPMVVILRDFGPDQITLLDRWLVVAGSIVAAAASWYFVEQPFRNRWPNFRIASRPLFLGAAVVWLCLMSVSTVVASKSAAAAGKADAAAMTGAFSWLDINTITNYDASSTMASGGIRLVPDGRPPRCVVVGTSHAMQLGPAIQDICENNHISCVFFCRTYMSALFARGTANFAPWIELRDPRRSRDEIVKAYIEKWKPDLIILAGKWSQEMEWRASFPEQTGSTFADELSYTMQWLSQHTSRLVVVSQIPALPITPGTRIIPMLWQRYGSGGTNLPVLDEEPQTTAARHEALDLIQVFAAPNTAIVNPDLFFFNQDKSIHYYSKRGIFYWDPNHLNALGSMQFTAALRPYFRELVFKQ